MLLIIWELNWAAPGFMLFGGGSVEVCSPVLGWRWFGGRHAVETGGVWLYNTRINRYLIAHSHAVVCCDRG